MESIQQFILKRLEENAEQAPLWQVVLDKRLVRLHGMQDGRCPEGCVPVLPCNTLCFIAMRWTDHPEFNKEWDIL